MLFDTRSETSFLVISKCQRRRSMLDSSVKVMTFLSSPSSSSGVTSSPDCPFLSCANYTTMSSAVTSEATMVSYTKKAIKFHLSHPVFDTMLPIYSPHNHFHFQCLRHDPLRCRPAFTALAATCSALLQHRYALIQRLQNGSSIRTRLSLNKA